MLAIGASTIGCAESPGPETATVTGKVTWKSEPVASATVSFQPTQSGVGKTCQATTNAEGMYQLETFVDTNTTKPGAIPGQYQVTVRKLELPTGEMAPPKSVLPDRYGDKQTSGLQANVQAGQPNRFDFELE